MVFMLAVLGFYGYSNTGKTTVIEYLIEELTNRGFKVATVKMTDKPISIDKEGKDTWRFAQKGAKITIMSTPVETGYILKQKEDLPSILNCIYNLGDVDVVLVEGAKDPSIKKIRFGDAPIRKNTVFTYDGNNEKILDFILATVEEERHMKDFIELKVNGKKIPLSKFPKDFIIQTIAGMVKSLRGVEEVREVEIHFKIED